jgi:membrane protein required for colicin V production
MTLIWVDYAIIAAIGFSALAGMIRGLIREVLSLLSWGLAIWVGLRFAREFSVWMNPLVPLPSARQAVAFGILFLATLITTGFIGVVLGKLVQTSGLSAVDQLAGLAFGIARGMLIVSALVLVAALTPLPEDPWWQQSKLIPPFQSLALWLRAQVPGGYGDFLKPSAHLKR